MSSMCFLGFMSNLECAHSIAFLFIFIYFFLNFLLCSVFFLTVTANFPLSLLLSPHLPPLFLFLLYCTYVSTQPKILSNSKASSSRLKGGARSGASFYDLDQRLFPYSPFFHRIIHILLHNKILLCYRLRS